MAIINGVYVPNAIANIHPDPLEQMQQLAELHKTGLVSDEDMKRATKQYAEYLMSPAVSIDPAVHYNGEPPYMHGHSMKPPHPGNGHASPAPAHNHALIPAKHKWHDHTLKSGMPGVVQAAMERAFMPDKEELRRTLAVRLRSRPGDVFPLDFIEFHVGKDKVYVFCVTPTGATIIEDGLDLFPSDALITAINLLKG